MLIPYFLLSGKDSNPHRRNQNPKCYHYTTGQICFASAKLRIYFGTAIANLEFFIRFNLFLHIYPQENKGHDIEDLMKKSYAIIESALPLKG